MFTKKKANRILSLFLSFLLFASIPVTSYAEQKGGEASIGSNAGTGGSGGVGTGGYMSMERTGYRFYLIDKDGNRVSNILDIVNFDKKRFTSDIAYWNANPNYPSDIDSTKYDWCMGAKNEDLRLARSEDERREQIWTINEANQLLRDSTGAGFLKLNGGKMPYYMDYESGTWTATGDGIKEWLVGGLPEIVNADGTVSYDAFAYISLYRV
mgnify:CR=1 FL=1